MHERELGQPKPPSNRGARIELITSSVVLVTSVATMVAGVERVIEATEPVPISMGALLRVLSEVGIPPQITLFALIYFSAVGVYDAVRRMRH